MGGVDAEAMCGDDERRQNEDTKGGCNGRTMSGGGGNVWRHGNIGGCERLRSHYHYGRQQLWEQR